MTYQGSIFHKLPGNLAREARRNARLRWAKVATVVAAGLLVGFVLQPAFGRDAYAAFYPVAPLCAWAMGPKPALAATALSALVAFVCLGPGLGAPDAASLAALGGFLAVSAASVGLVSGLAQGVAQSRRPAARPAAPTRKAKPAKAAAMPVLEPASLALAAEPQRRRAIG